MRFVFNWLLFISSYIPMFIMLFIGNLNSFSKKSVFILLNQDKVFWISLFFILVVAFISLLFWLGLLKKEFNTDGNRPKYTVKKFKSIDSEILIIFVLFLFPLLSCDPSFLPSVILNLILLIIGSVYFVSENLFCYNILLLMLGYHFYTFDYESDKPIKTIITRKRKEELAFKTLSVSQLGTTNIFYL